MSHRAGTGDAPIPGLVTSSFGLRGRVGLDHGWHVEPDRTESGLQAEAAEAEGVRGWAHESFSAAPRDEASQEAEAAAEAARRAEIAKLKAAKQRPPQLETVEGASEVLKL